MYVLDDRMVKNLLTNKQQPIKQTKNMDSRTSNNNDRTPQPQPQPQVLMHLLSKNKNNNNNSNNNEHNNIKIAKLTISDDHVNFLIEEEEENDDNNDNANLIIKSILKLNLVPLHKHMLISTKTDNDDESTTTEGYLTFLRNFHWILSSESGAEYSYYKLLHYANNNGEPEVGGENRSDDDDDENSTIIACWGSGGFLYSIISSIRERWRQQQQSNFSAACGGGGGGGGLSSSNLLSTTTATTTNMLPLFNAELISPASSKQIARVMPSSDGYVMIEETPQMYNQIVKPHIDGIAQSGSLDWVQNIVNGTKEIERLLINRQDWILNIDTKWRTHPNPLVVPRSEWYNHPSTQQDLYCLGIVKDNNIQSIRDLRQKHIPLLKEMIDIGSTTILDIYGIPKNQLRIFVHYQPQFYWFHVHYTRLENEIGSTCERGHLLMDIIQNLQLKSTYYSEEKTITYKLNRNDQLYHKLENSTQKMTL